jgi:hypothetical protein
MGASDADEQGNASSATGARSRRLAALLPAGAGRRARAGGKWLAHALLIFVPAMFSASLTGSGIQPTEVVAAVRNTSVEVVLPEGGRGLQLSCSCGSVVLPVDRVGGPPDLDFTDEGDARLTARRSPAKGQPGPANTTGSMLSSEALAIHAASASPRRRVAVAESGTAEQQSAL